MVEPLNIISDSREKKPYEFADFDHEVTVEALETGDYTVEGFEDAFAVERKTLDDFLSSITWDRDRFKREVKRAKSMIKFVVIIEEKKRTVTNWDYYREVHPNAVIATIDAWEKQYNVEFVWGGDRERAEKLTVDFLTGWFDIYSRLYD